MLIARTVVMGRSFVWIPRGGLAMLLELTDKAAWSKAWVRGCVFGVGMVVGSQSFFLFFCVLSCV